MNRSDMSDEVKLYTGKKIVFLAQGVSNPMFLIQSLPVLKELKVEYDINLISIEEDSIELFDLEKNQKLYDDFIREFKLEMVKTRKLLYLPKILNSLIQIVPWLIIKSKKNNLKYFHARGYLPAIVLHYLRKILTIKYIFDMRGVYVDELKLLQNMSEKNLKIRLWRHLEKKAIKSSESVVVVSKPFADYVKNINPQTKVSIIKNSIVNMEIGEEDYKNVRHKYRARLGIDNKKVWIYSGSAYKWQLIPQMISLFKNASELEQDLHFLMICRENTREIKQIFKELDLSDDLYTILSVNPKEVMNYLMAGDIGILLREHSIINEVSDPLKFVEYLHAGLLVMISKHIGDTEELVKKHELGIVLESIDNRDFKKYIDPLNMQLKNRNPIKIIKKANSIYKFDHSVKAYSDCYQNLMS
jgi:hypothetical protein